ncbi:MAG: TlpA family protein disulfide reductase [Burkholderiales bacterium]
MGTSWEKRTSNDFKRRSGWHFIVLGIALAIAVAAVLWWRSPVSAPAVTVVSLQGERIALDALRGKVVLVNFWATDCGPCRQEMPAMAETYRRYRPHGLEAIFIAMPYDRPDHVLHFARSSELPFPVALDIQGEAARAFGGVRATPTAFLVDKRGRIVERILGVPDFGRLQSLIERKLAERV